MTKKFTEEQYQKIVRTYESTGEYVNAISLVLDYIDELNLAGYQEAILLAIPKSREWAHDKFVEKDKKYIWTSKEVNSSGKHKRLFIQQQSASVRDYFILDKHGYDENELITESEIKKWGYAPERFYKEEV